MSLCCLLLQIAFFSIAGSLSALDTFYCDSPGRQNIVASSADGLRLITRNQSASGYRAGSVCEFLVIAPPGSLLFVELQLDSVADGLGPGTTLTLASGSRLLLRVSPPLPLHATSLVTPAGLLSVHLRVPAGAPVRPGLVILVRPFRHCPPGWIELSNACYGTAGVGAADSLRQLSFLDSQLACNYMRSNLLTFAYGVQGAGEIGEVRRRLSSWSRGLGVSGAWIGLTDATVWGRFAYYWLDRGRFGEHSEIGCSSGSSAYRNCQPEERCGLLSWLSSDSAGSNPLLMSACGSAHPYLCAMPIGGTDRFDRVPAGALPNATDYGASEASARIWLWLVVLATVLVAALLFGAVCLAVRYFGSDKRDSRLRQPVARANQMQLHAPPPPPPYTLVDSLHHSQPAPTPPPYAPLDSQANEQAV